MIVELLNRFDPEPEGLLREISKHIDDEMLEQIASADYGQDSEKHFMALRQIRDTSTFPEKMDWYPGEVLELTRWLEPYDPEWKPEQSGSFDHWTRAFSCAALLRATREPYNYGDGIATDTSLLGLIQSLRALPVDFNQRATQFLAWLLLHSEPEGRNQQVCAYGIGLLWFSLQLAGSLSDGTLISLAKWIVRRSIELFPRLIFEGNPLPLRMGVGNPPPTAWSNLGVALFDLKLSSHSTELQKLVETIALELSA